ncbi:ABC transporter substrate-binding protein [Pararhizobium mangrovi]|uniref:ABC transporter substrate-binding protein n=1 Tax=Pararhizobium mangrovi TaxID=2590452 RepID=UPI0015E82CDE|nr:ABC transporter substrate-binding protein [Pararhizobium mangrovi]
MRATPVLVAFVGLLLVSAQASAALRLGVVAPKGDQSYAVLGDQFRQGVRAYRAEHPDAFSDIVEVGETCEDEAGPTIGKQLVDAKVDAVVGFFCPESLNAALPILAGAHIPTLTATVRADIVAERPAKENWPFFRLAPSEDMLTRKIADVIEARWADEPFAIVEDGTIYGRVLAENVNALLKQNGLTPSFTDTFRPADEKQVALANRLERAGVTRVFVGGQRDDVAVIARDCRKIGLDLTFLGGDALRAPKGDVPLPDGTLAVMMPQPWTLPSAKDALAALKAHGIEPYGEPVPGYAAASVIAAAEKSDEPLGKALATERFDTALGPIRFGPDHERTDNPFELMVWRDDAFVPADDRKP